MIRKLILFFKKNVLNYTLSDEEEDFISLNYQQWSPISKGTVGILVEGFLDSPTSIVEKARLARAAAEASGLDVVVNIRGVRVESSNVAKIYRSFDINNFNCWWLNYFNPFVILPAALSFFEILIFFRKGDELVNYSKHSLVIGDLIYDSLIRNIPNSYTIDKLSIIKHGRLLFRSMCFFYGNRRLVKIYQPKVLVTSHNVYAEYGMLCRLAHQAGAIVLLKDMDVYKIYTRLMNVNQHFLMVDPSIVEREIIESNLEKELIYFNSRVLGISKQVDIQNAYKDKQVYTRPESISLHPYFSEDKKNVVVMAHAFSDAPHVGEGLLFRDYLQQTLISLNKNEDINCFVKSHPSSYMWGEKGGVESIVENNNLTNICVLPLDYNTKSILDVADVVVTAKGTAGLEFSCAGIPAITAGKGYYYGFDICQEPETLEEYIFSLANCQFLNPLSSERKNKALIVLYQSFNRLFHSAVLPEVQIRPGDDYQMLYRKKFDEMNRNLRLGIPMQDEFYTMILADIRQALNA